MRKVLITLSIGLMFNISSTFAHHGFSSEFDKDKVVTLRGTVTAMEWTNPHAWLYIDVKDDAGKVVNWGIECGAPNVLVRRGFTRDSLPVGMVVIVRGYQARNGSAKASGSGVTFPDGRKLFVGAPSAEAPAREK